MEITLNLSKEKSDVFQEYLHAEIRKISSSPFGLPGRAGYRDDGRYEIVLEINLPTESSSIPLQLIVLIEQDGSINRLCFRSNIEEMEESAWGMYASNFINGVLASALAENLSRHFIRSTFCLIGADLDGEYWLPGFRLSPAMPENERSYLFDAERYIYIDQEVDAIDQMHAGDVASERALQYSARLSLILNKGLSKPQSGMKWFLEHKEGEGTVPKLGRLGFMQIPPSGMPEKGTECRLGKFNTSLFADPQNPTASLLMCPRETRMILRGLDCCPPDIRDAFDSCARLYQISLTAGRGFPTIRLAYQVGAIDSISQKVSGYKGFSDFIKKEYPIPDNSHDDFLNQLYRTVRSAHLHGGAFPLGEYKPRKLGWGVGNVESHNNFNFDLYASKLIRQSIVNWINKTIIPEGAH